MPDRTAARPALATRLLRPLTGAVLATLAATAVLHAPGAPGAPLDARASQVTSTTSGAGSATAARRPVAASTAAVPGSFTGYGFDQCLAPAQSVMDRWLESSPFLAVGIYISGDSRGCRSQPNLTPTWVATQRARGWRLLPITLGPQASCSASFPRYGNDPTIDPSAAGDYAAARQQGLAEAAKSVGAAQALGLGTGSTLWYDLEGFATSQTACRESALSFLGGWTEQLHAQGYASGVYSSAGSGIAQLDAARTTRPTRFALPDAIWIARWDGAANTSTTYIGEDGWRPGGRIKQYQGGHSETWGGISLTIDSDYLELGRPVTPSAKTQCGGTQVEFAAYSPLHPPREGKASGTGQVSALQCLLAKKGLLKGRPTGRYDDRTTAAVRGWLARAGLPVKDTWNRKAWQSLLAAGSREVLKTGSTGMSVRRVQRALSVGRSGGTPATGVYDATTTAAVRAWQSRVGLEASGVIGADDWPALQAGRR